MPFQIIYKDIWLFIIYFYTIRIIPVECLQSLVCGKSNVFTTGMPTWVNKRRDFIGNFSINLFHLITIYNISSPIYCTHMEQHFVRILIWERVAIHAVLIGLWVCENGLFFKVCNISLINPHLVPRFISWGN